MNVKRFTDYQSRKFITGHKNLNRRRLDWKTFEKRVRKTYKPILDELSLEKFGYNTLSLESRKDLFKDEGETNQNFIQVRMGLANIGLVKKKESSSEFLFEKGATLVFSQDPQGKVIVILYPYKSEVLEFNEEYIFYGIYKTPLSLKPYKLRRILRFYFRYSYSTSIIGKQSLIMRVRLLMIRYKVSFDVMKFGKSIFSVASSIAGMLPANKNSTNN